ncbi:GNAT family N-acetyltransferase, partial [Faecalispora jeddahensis]
MQCTIRTWRPSDAADLAAAMNNPNILKNLRDGIPYPYTQADAEEYIRTMLGAEPGSQYAFAIEV